MPDSVTTLFPIDSAAITIAADRPHDSAAQQVFRSDPRQRHRTSIRIRSESCVSCIFQGIFSLSSVKPVEEGFQPFRTGIALRERFLIAGPVPAASGGVRRTLSIGGLSCRERGGRWICAMQGASW
jgi:hypothetical protein